MFGFGGLGEILFILFVAMLIFGPEKLPEIGRLLAKGMNEVRKASNELKRTLNAELAISEQEQEARRMAQLEAAPPPPPAAWSGGLTVPNEPATAVPATAAAGVAAFLGGETVEGAAVEGAAVESGEAAAGDAAAVEWTESGPVTRNAAESSDAAYLADWPEEGKATASPGAAAAPEDLKSTQAIPTPVAPSASSAPSAAPTAVLVEQVHEGGGRDEA